MNKKLVYSIQVRIFSPYGTGYTDWQTKGQFDTPEEAQTTLTSTVRVLQSVAPYANIVSGRVIEVIVLE